MSCSSSSSSSSNMRWPHQQCVNADHRYINTTTITSSTHTQHNNAREKTHERIEKYYWIELNSANIPASIALFFRSFARSPALFLLFLHHSRIWFLLLVCICQPFSSFSVFNWLKIIFNYDIQPVFWQYLNRHKFDVPIFDYFFFGGVLFCFDGFGCFFRFAKFQTPKKTTKICTALFLERKKPIPRQIRMRLNVFLLSQLFIGLLNSLSVIQMTGKNCINFKSSRKERWVNWNYSHISGCVVYINCARSVNPGISTNLKITPINRFNSCCAALRCDV